MAEAMGAGLIWFMGRDHLSPPLSNADEYALNSKRWREASSSRVVNLAQRMGISLGDTVLDLGCGIGGPGRDIADTTGATVYGLSISINQLRNLRRLSSSVGSTYTGTIVGDMQQTPFKAGSFDHAYSINAVYHVNYPASVIADAYRVLRPAGRFGVDDWFATDQTTTYQLAKLRNNWSTSSSGFHNFDQFRQQLSTAGFTIMDVLDFTNEAGAFLAEDRFGATYDDQVAPLLLDAFPQLYQYEGYQPDHAEKAVSQLRSDILYMGELYRTGSAVYRQIIAEKIPNQDR